MHAELRGTRSRHQVAEDVGEHRDGDSDRRAGRDRGRDRSTSIERGHATTTSSITSRRIRLGKIMDLVDRRTDERGITRAVVVVEEPDDALAPAGMLADLGRGQSGGAARCRRSGRGGSCVPGRARRAGPRGSRFATRRSARTGVRRSRRERRGNRGLDRHCRDVQRRPCEQEGDPDSLDDLQRASVGAGIRRDRGRRGRAARPPPRATRRRAANRRSESPTQGPLVKPESRWQRPPPPRRRPMRGEACEAVEPVSAASDGTTPYSDGRVGPTAGRRASSPPLVEVAQTNPKVTRTARNQREN